MRDGKNTDSPSPPSICIPISLYRQKWAILLTETMTLRDGRTLAFDIYGDPDGSPVIFSHGFSDSHVIRNPDDKLTASLGACWISADQPGVGGSSPKKGRRMVDWGPTWKNSRTISAWNGSTLRATPAADRTHSRSHSICPIGFARSRWHPRYLLSTNRTSLKCS